MAGPRRPTQLSSYRTALREEAIAWHVSPRLAESLFVLPFVGALAVVASRVNRSVFLLVVDEDRLLEWLQFAGFAAASILAFACAIRLKQQGLTGLALLYLIFALGCFFIAGEEIAWGQRIIGYGTPATLKDVNEQEEVTLHNINSVQNLTNIAYLLIGLYGSVIVWLLGGQLTRRLGAVTALVMPPLFLTGAFFVVFAYKLLRFTLFPESGFTITQLGEWPEFCLALGFSGFAAVIWRQLRAGAPVPVRVERERFPERPRPA